MVPVTVELAASPLWDAVTLRGWSKVVTQAP